MQKQLEGTQKILMSSADRVAHIDGQLIIIVSNTHALPAATMFATNRATYECLLGFCFNNIFCAATNFAVSTKPLTQKRRNDG